MLPIVRVEKQTQEIWARWPPKSKTYKTISPDAESNELYGQFVRDKRGMFTARGRKDEISRTMFLFTRWPEPLGSLIPAADGIDMFVAQAQMAMVAKESATDPIGALRRAREQATAYVLEGHSTLRWTWLWPTYLYDGEPAVLFEAEDRGIKANSLSELSKNAKFQKAMMQPIQVRRAWGPTGLFWALLLEQLEGLTPVDRCQLCGRVITGKRGKQFCGKQDSAKCYRRRRALDQQRLRAQH
jgi:hypothetical protein